MSSLTSNARQACCRLVSLNQLISCRPVSTVNFMKWPGRESGWTAHNNCLYTRKPRARLSTSVFNNIQQRSIGTLPSNIVFRQLFDHKSFTLTYLLGDKSTGEAILIDPVIELVKRDVNLMEDLNLKLIYAVNTHCHADHITGTGELKKRIPSCRSAISKASGAKADLYLEEGDKLCFGEQGIHALSTPGHTSGCMTFVLSNAGRPIMAFTGDAVLIRGCGRTDFQEGDSSVLYESVHGKIFSLPEDTVLYPAHDYTGQCATTVGEEIKFNPRLSQSKEKFLEIMKQLNLPYPKAIDKALPANMVCGMYESEPTR